MINKELKLKAVFKLKKMSIIDKDSKIKAEKLAKKYASEVDLSEVFKE